MAAAISSVMAFLRRGLFKVSRATPPSRAMMTCGSGPGPDCSLMRWCLQGSKRCWSAGLVNCVGQQGPQLARRLVDEAGDPAAPVQLVAELLPPGPQPLGVLAERVLGGVADCPVHLMPG